METDKMLNNFFRVILSTILLLAVNYFLLPGGSLFADTEPGCYESLGYGALQRTSAIGNFGDECSNMGFSGFLPVANKCYSWSGDTEPVEFDCSGVKQCGKSTGEVRSTGEGGTNYLAQLFAPNAANCEQVVEAIIQGDRDAGGLVDPIITVGASPGVSSNPADANKLYAYVQIFVIIVSVAGGIAIVGSLVWAGIKYATAGGDSGAVSKAKTRIVFTLIALLIYLMLYSVVTWLIPSDIV
jgi:hypothetical protein